MTEAGRTEAARTEAARTEASRAGQVAVVTDSTAYLPEGVAAARGITVVPLHVVLGLRSGTEGADVTPADVAAALHERRIAVSTSRPVPADFAAAYRATGASRIVSIHLSGLLSGTVDSARAAAEQVEPDGIEVRVVDSRTIAMAMGFAVLAAARCAGDGGDLDAVADRATSVAGSTLALFYVDTLEHLRRGGRIGAASALLGAALAVKPLLHMQDGRIALLEKVRTSAKALARIEELAVAYAGTDPVDVAVHHLEAPERARVLADRLGVILPGLRSMHVSEVGAVVGAHVGPGLLAVAVSR